MATDTAILVELIKEYGGPRERMRMEVQAADPFADPPAGGAFAADLVFQGDNGFELWLGSLEDALSLEGLVQRNIDGILNCALDDCQAECACSRPVRSGRARSHARGPSSMNNGDFTPSHAVEGVRKLDREHIRELASFDGDWYSTMLGRSIAYLGIAAKDAPGYAMDEHFSETCSFLGGCNTEGRKVLVHCVQGINRSSAALVAFLCHALAMELEAAVVLASKQRGLILSNDDFLAQLVRCYGQKSAPHTWLDCSI